MTRSSHPGTVGTNLACWTLQRRVIEIASSPEFTTGTGPDRLRLVHPSESLLRGTSLRGQTSVHLARSTQRPQRQASSRSRHDYPPARRGQRPDSSGPYLSTAMSATVSLRSRRASPVGRCASGKPACDLPCRVRTAEGLTTSAPAQRDLNDLDRRRLAEAQEMSASGRSDVARPFDALLRAEHRPGRAASCGEQRPRRAPDRRIRPRGGPPALPLCPCGRPVPVSQYEARLSPHRTAARPRPGELRTHDDPVLGQHELTPDSPVAPDCANVRRPAGYTLRSLGPTADPTSRAYLPISCALTCGDTA